MIFLIKKKHAITIAIVVVILLVIGIVALIFKNNSHREVFSTETTTNKPIDHGSAESNYVAFACNVDWGNEVIPEMLNTLNEKEVKITFFVTGRWAKEYPDKFRLIIDQGHEIGSHGYQHLDYGKLSLDKNLDQIQKAEEVIRSITGEKPTLFAPPSGAYNENTLIAAEKLKYKTILWTIDTIDWRKGSTKEVIIDRVLNKKVEHNGAIVLMHPMPDTAEALETLIDKYREKGLEVGRVSDVLK